MNEPSKENEDFIAIVGMGCRLPGASDPMTLWQKLAGGEELTTPVDDAMLLSAGIDPATVDTPSYVRRGAFIDDFDHFDNRFFDIPGAEAEILDPQQRVFLETAWHALEDAGIVADEYAGKIGLFAGSAANTYLRHVLPLQDHSPSLKNFNATNHNDKDFLTTRTSYKLNLRGPSLALQTACSTSLVAVHLACQSLLLGESDVAMAGGVCIRVPHTTGYWYDKGSILSPDGHCRPFSADAEGTIPANGAGIVVLKRLEDALSDDDRIYAVIRGSAINNDGSLKMGYTAPSPDSQAEVIADALAVAGVSAEDVGYIEAHGTGTNLGDPIEIKALSQAFAESTDRRQFCRIGSIKSNLGHLDTAAGVTSLIKTALCIYHGSFVPSLNFSAANPEIDFEKTPFLMSTCTTPWTDEQRIAGVSSFGIGGTNAHVVLSRQPQTLTPRHEQPLIFPLSAKTDDSLKQMVVNFRNHVDAEEICFHDISYTLTKRRSEFNHRAVFVAEDRSELIKKIDEYLRDQNRPRIASPVDCSQRQTCEDISQGWLNGDMSLSQFEVTGKVASLPGYSFERKPFYIALQAPITTPTPTKEATTSHEDLNAQLNELVLQACKDNLGEDDVSAADNFFELGGDSILALQICSQLSETLALDVPASWLVEEESIEQFTQKVKSQIDIALQN